jgi:general secretion pathway protein G
MILPNKERAVVTKRHNQKSKSISSEAGFTLTELLVVLLILSLIAAAITPQIMGRLDSSKVRAGKLQLETLGTSLDMYKIDTGAYPTTEEGLSVLLVRPQNVTVWDGPYVKFASSLIDPWRNEFVYEGLGGRYRLTTYGADGEEGGEDYDADMIFPDYSLPSEARNSS